MILECVVVGLVGDLRSTLDCDCGLPGRDLDVVRAMEVEEEGPEVGVSVVDEELVILGWDDDTRGSSSPWARTDDTTTPLPSEERSKFCCFFQRILLLPMI